MLTIVAGQGLLRILGSTVTAYPCSSHALTTKSRSPANLRIDYRTRPSQVRSPPLYQLIIPRTLLYA